jgi:hypothetical protein
MAMTEAAKREFVEVGPGIVGEQSGAGIALAVLGILALANVNPGLLISIAVIVAGIALTAEGVSLSTRYARTLRAAGGEGASLREWSTELSAGVLGGAAGVVLGILAILGIATETLVPIALIVFGAAVLLDFGAEAHVKALGAVPGGSPADLTRLALAGASSSMASVLVSVSLITLGILGLAHLEPAILAAAAFLVLGTYLLLDSVAASGWMTDRIS